MTDSSLFNSELEFQQQEELYQQLLSQVILNISQWKKIELVEAQGVACIFLKKYILFHLSIMTVVQISTGFNLG